MKHEKQLHVMELAANVEEIEKAVDVLSSHKVLSYIVLLLNDEQFEKPSNPAFGDISNKSAYLEGANAALTRLGSLPEALRDLKLQK